MTHSFYVLGHSHSSDQALFHTQHAAVYKEKALTNSLYAACRAPNGKLTKLTASLWMYLAAKKEIFP